MSAPNFSTRIQDMHSLLQNIGRCSHLAVSRSRLFSCCCYFHHFIVRKIPDNEIGIIQYGSDQSGDVILEETVDIRSNVCAELLDFNAGLYLINDPSYPTTDAEIDMVLARARSRLRERKYQASYNNCEHFVHFAFTGIPYCDQLRNCGFLKKGFFYLIDEVVEYKNKIFDGFIKVVSIRTINSQFYYEIVKELFEKNPEIFQTLFGSFGETIKSIAEKIASVASHAQISKGCIAVVEIGMLLRYIVELSEQYQNGHICAKDLVIQILKRMIWTITAVALDWGFLSGYILSIPTFLQTLLFVFLVFVAQVLMSCIYSILVEKGIDISLWIWHIVQTAGELLQAASPWFAGRIFRNLQG